MKSIPGALICAIGALACMTSTGAELGQLFFSVEERAAFEAARQAAAAPPVVASEEPEPDVLPEIIIDEPIELRPNITVDGYVRRSHGGATLWVNGENNYDGNLAASHIDPLSAKVRGSAIELQPLDEAPIMLKPGQSYDPNSRTTVDAYDTARSTFEVDLN
jgi:hypothetical protein